VEAVTVKFSIKDIELQEFTMPEDGSFEYPEMDEGKWHFKSSFTFEPLSATQTILKTHLTYYLYLKEDPLQTPIIYISIITAFAVTRQLGADTRFAATKNLLINTVAILQGIYAAKTEDTDACFLVPPQIPSIEQYSDTIKDEIDDKWH
jgi:hypothetical protein